MTNFNMIKPRLPAEYQEVEYIQSDGGQYINTNFIPSNKTKIKTKVYINSNVRWTGSRPDGNNNMFGCSFADNPYRNYYYFGNQFISGLTTIPEPNTGYEAIYVINDNNKTYFNGQLDTTLPNLTFTSTLPIWILAVSGNSLGKLVGKIYYYDIYEDNIPVRLYVPCFRRSDGVIGLYDLCRSVCPLTGTPFYINAGTGSFAKGPDVQPLIPLGIAGKIGKFNQLFDIAKNFTHTVLGVSVTTDNNHTIHFYGTPNSTGGRTSFQGLFSYTKVSLTSGHKYLLAGRGAFPSNSLFYMNKADYSTLANLTYNGMYISTYTGDVTLGWNFTSTSITYDNYFMICLYDLTDIFDSGNEPTTYAQARRLIKLKYGIDIADYHPYGLNQAVPGLKRLIGA